MCPTTRRGSTSRPVVLFVAQTSVQSVESELQPARHTRGLPGLRNRSALLLLPLSHACSTAGGWLYQLYAMFEDPAIVGPAYGISNTAGLGVCGGGLPIEGAVCFVCCNPSPCLCRHGLRCIRRRHLGGAARVGDLRNYRCVHRSPLTLARLRPHSNL